MNLTETKISAAEANAPVWREAPRTYQESYSLAFLLRWAAKGLIDANHTALAAELFEREHGLQDLMDLEIAMRFPR